MIYNIDRFHQVYIRSNEIPDITLFIDKIIPNVVRCMKGK